MTQDAGSHKSRSPTPPRSHPTTPSTLDIAVIGAGAAGLMAALAARGAITSSGASVTPEDGSPEVRIFDGSPRVGLKILVSGGGRCNVTNERVDERDYDSDAPKIVRSVLRELAPAAVTAFFEHLGCPLQAEPLGKLFPRSDDARDVLKILLDAVATAGIAIEAGRKVIGVAADPDGVTLSTSHGTLRARRVIVASGGKSLPKTGSTGFGLELATKLGHSLDPPLPALVPVVLGRDGPLDDLAGVTVPALLSLVPLGTSPEQVESRRLRPLARAGGSVLITHDGISGPAALDVSGRCGLALLDNSPVVLEADFLSLAIRTGPFAPYLDLPKLPGACLPDSPAETPMSLDDLRALMEDPSATPRQTVAGLVARWLPRSLAQALLKNPPAGAETVDPNKEVHALSNRDWQAIHRATCHADLRLRGTGGYQKAEVTRGGVPLRELFRGTLESRLAPAVHFCGEVCSATGRLGGFNFQWAWSSGFVAGRGAARLLAETLVAEAESLTPRRRAPP